MRYLALIFSFLIISAYAPLSIGSDETYTDVPIELKGIMLHSSIETIKQQFPDVECESDDNVLVYCTVKKTSFADSNATLNMTFIDGILLRYSFSNIPISNYPLIHDSLTSKYGKPMRDGKADNGLVRELGTGNYVRGIDFWRSSNQDTLGFKFDKYKKFPSVFEVFVNTKKYFDKLRSAQSQEKSNKKVSSDI